MPPATAVPVPAVSTAKTTAPTSSSTPRYSAAVWPRSERIVGLTVGGHPRAIHGPEVSTVPWDLPMHCDVAVPSYRGAFGEEQAARLLWRAGFGPRPGQAAELAKRGLRGAVQALTRPGSK